jgi:hypothetical protein
VGVGVGSGVGFGVGSGVGLGVDAGAADTISTSSVARSAPVASSAVSSCTPTSIDAGSSTLTMNLPRAVVA